MDLLLMDDDNQPTNQFTALVDDIVRTTIKARSQTLPQSGDFFVPAVCHKDGSVSYWGVLDMAATPDEDLYIEAERRFYAATQVVGQWNILGFGLVCLPAVINRTPFGGIPKPPPISPFGP